MKFKNLVVMSLVNLAFAFSSQASLMTLASDDANNYGNQWLGNGGYGFDEWNFITDSAGGGAGGFLANKSNNGDLNHIASNPSDNAWGSYANGNGFNQFEAYRGFSSDSLTQAGDIFQVSFEHGDIINGGSVGFALRNQNIHNAIGDYNQLSRFEFGFVGGGQHYSIFNGDGVIETGIEHTYDGLNLTLTLLGSDSYQLDIFDAFDNSSLHSSNGTLKGSGSIDSVSLYNRNAEDGDAFFNNLSISKNVVAVPEPTTLLLLCLSLGALLIRNKRKMNF